VITKYLFTFEDVTLEPGTPVLRTGTYRYIPLNEEEFENLRFHFGTSRIKKN
jgi:hypothetical protein